LLAEDNLKLRQLLKGLAEAHAGWLVCGETGDGLEAVAKGIELNPDVVVLDFAMPRLNGLQVAGKLLSACPTLPIILHTVHFFPAMVDEAKKIGIRARRIAHPQRTRTRVPPRPRPSLRRSNRGPPALKSGPR